ncbi:MAG TPA: ATP-binding protein [Candidatus Saccharimonadales bacterium]|jgi:ATP-dependent DNA helicase RecG
MRDSQNQFSLFAEDVPEQSLIEYKTSKNGNLPKDIWESITAFTNADGGKIIFGITPDQKHVGLSVGDIDLIQRNIQSDTLNSYSFRIHTEISVVGDTVTVYVPPAPAPVRPVYHLKQGPVEGARVRVGSSNEKLDDEWIRRFAVAAKGGAELLWIDASAEIVLDKAAITQYIEKLNKTRGGVYTKYTYDELLPKLNIVNDKNQISLFGMLSFSNDASLQDLVSPTMTVSITQYTGTAKVTTDGTTAYRDKREFFGPVNRQFDAALAYILDKVPIQGVIDKKSGLRTDDYLVPALAIREALANTLAHRDYSVHSSKIQIDLYADRIEFINPGKSLIPINELERTSSATRNPLLMNFMREMGYTEHLARGIRTIKYELRKAGLKEPSFQNTSTSFVATIHSTAFITAEDKAWLEKFKGLRLNERQMACLIVLKTSMDGINNSEYRELNGLNQMGDDKKTNKELRRMVDKGVLVKHGDYINTRYYLADAYITE